MKNNKFIWGMFVFTFAMAPFAYNFKDQMDQDRAPASIYEIDLLRFDSIEQSKSYLETAGKDIEKLKQIKNDIIESKEKPTKKLAGLKDLSEQTSKIYQNIEKAMLKKVALTKDERDELKKVESNLLKELESLEVKEVISSLEEEIPKETKEDICKKDENPVEKLAHQFDKFLIENESIISLFNIPMKKEISQQQFAFANPNNIIMQMQLQASVPMNPYNFLNFNPLYSFFMNQSLGQFMSYATGANIMPSNQRYANNPTLGMQQNVDLMANELGFTRIISGPSRESHSVESFNILK